MNVVGQNSCYKANKEPEWRYVVNEIGNIVTRVNYINSEGKYISKEWFDRGSKYNEKGKYMFVEKNGQIHLMDNKGVLSKESIIVKNFERYEFTDDCLIKVMRVDLNSNKRLYNFIDKDFDLLYENWLSEEELKSKDKTLRKIKKIDNLENIVKCGKDLFKDDYSEIKYTEDGNYFIIKKKLDCILPLNRHAYTVADLEGKFLLKNRLGIIQWFSDIEYLGGDKILAEEEYNINKVFYLKNGKKFSNVTFKELVLVEDDYCIVKKKDTYFDKEKIYLYQDNGKRYNLPKEILEIVLNVEYNKIKNVLLVKTSKGYNLYHLGRKRFILPKDYFDIKIMEDNVVLASDGVFYYLFTEDGDDIFFDKVNEIFYEGNKLIIEKVKTIDGEIKRVVNYGDVIYKNNGTFFT